MLLTGPNLEVIVYMIAVSHVVFLPICYKKENAANFHHHQHLKNNNNYYCNLERSMSGDWCI